MAKKTSADIFFAHQITKKYIIVRQKYKFFLKI